MSNHCLTKWSKKPTPIALHLLMERLAKHLNMENLAAAGDDRAGAGGALPDFWEIGDQAMAHSFYVNEKGQLEHSHRGGPSMLCYWVSGFIMSCANNAFGSHVQYDEGIGKFHDNTCHIYPSLNHYARLMLEEYAGSGMDAEHASFYKERILNPHERIAGHLAKAGFDPALADGCGSLPEPDPLQGFAEEILDWLAVSGKTLSNADKYFLALCHFTLPTRSKVPDFLLEGLKTEQKELLAFHYLANPSAEGCYPSLAALGLASLSEQTQDKIQKFKKSFCGSMNNDNAGDQERRAAVVDANLARLECALLAVCSRKCPADSRPAAAKRKL